MKKDAIQCPQCGKNNTWTPENTAKPFCSDRCKLIDLGEWAAEKYKIPVETDELKNNSSDAEDDK